MAKYIKGHDRNQIVLFPEKIDDLIEYDNEVRVIDKFVDVIDINEKEELEKIEEIESTETLDGEDIRKLAVENGCFIKDKEHNKVFCPQGEILRPKSKKKDKTKYCNKMACKRCKNPCTYAKFKELVMGDSQVIVSSTGNTKGKELKKKYNPKQKKRRNRKKVVKVKLKPKEEDLKLRMGTSEHVHGTLKRADDASYLLLKGLEKVNGELALSYCAINLRRLINILGIEKILEYLNKKTVQEEQPSI